MNKIAAMPDVPGVTTRFQFHHVGCAVRSIEEALAYFTDVLGLRQCSAITHVPSQQVNICMLSLGPAGFLELVEGVGDDSHLHRHLAAKGAGPYHLCFQVDDIDDAIRQLVPHGFHKLKRFETPLEDVKRFAFLLTPDRQLLELCQA